MKWVMRYREEGYPYAFLAPRIEEPYQPCGTLRGSRDSSFDISDAIRYDSPGEGHRDLASRRNMAPGWSAATEEEALYDVLLLAVD